VDSDANDFVEPRSSIAIQVERPSLVLDNAFLVRNLAGWIHS
jgi:hypothetical protein